MNFSISPCEQESQFLFNFEEPQKEDFLNTNLFCGELDPSTLEIEEGQEFLNPIDPYKESKENNFYFTKGGDNHFWSEEPQKSDKSDQEVATKEPSEVDTKSSQIGSETTSKSVRRNDLVLRSLLRSIRRYLWSLFTKDHKLPNPRKRFVPSFRQDIEEFYLKHFKSKSKVAQSLSPEEQEGVCFCLSSFLTSKHTYSELFMGQPKGHKASPENLHYRRLFSTLKQLFKNYTVRNYTRFIQTPETKILLQIFQELNLISTIISSCPKLLQDPDLYKENFDQILQNTHT